MRYDPTQYEASAYAPVDKGDYPFVVIDASETVSEAGNEMMSLTLACDVGRDKPMNIFDHLVSSPAALWKLEQFCSAVGLDFKSGELYPENALGKSGIARLVLGKPKAKGANKGKQYMEVKWYVSRQKGSRGLQPDGYREQPGAAGRAAAAPTHVGGDDDNIPF